MTPWRERLDRAIAADPTQPFGQLATVTPAGGPAVRTVRFRFFLPGDRLVLSTDLRAEKARDLRTRSAAEFCWWFPVTREQFRLSGPVVLATAESAGQLAEARLQSWADRPAESRQGFTWPPAGEPRAADAAFALPAPADPPASFGLIMLAPDRVDYLDVRPHPHLRLVFRRTAGGWVEEAVNP